MADELENPTPEENPSPTSPGSPAEQGTLNTADSEPVEATPEAPESSPEGFSDESSNTQAPLESSSGAGEPLNEGVLEGESKEEKVPEQVEDTVRAPEPEANPVSSETNREEPRAETAQSRPIEPFRLSIRKLFEKAQSVLQFRKRKKLERIMNLFKDKYGSTSSPQVSNDDVEKLLHVSDATATRYLSILEKEGKIKQLGKTGRGVSYVRAL